MADAVCAVETCGRPLRLAGYCGAHHQRLLRHGDVRAHIPLRGKPHPAGQLWCSVCEALRDQATFHRNRGTLTGYDGVCKPCVKARQERQRVHRAAVQKAWREKNAERIREKKRAAGARIDREKKREYSRRWRAANPDKVKQHIQTQNRNRYARLKNAKGSASGEAIKARWDYYGGKCWMCAAPAVDMDHVKPLAAGGSHWPANQRPACATCNRRKGGRWPWPLEVARARSTASR